MPGRILVLVAEDEELIRYVIAEALRDEGIEVMEAEHAEAALDVLEQHAARIHVLFTDIQMPGAIDGLTLAHHASKKWPHIALLITSGRPRPDWSRFPEKSRFVAKPYLHSRVIRKRMVRWSRKLGQVVKLGSPFEKDEPDDGETATIRCGVQGESCS